MMGEPTHVPTLPQLVTEEIESTPDKGEPSSKSPMQEKPSEKRELRPLKGAKAPIWLHFGFLVVEGSIVNMKEVECRHCGAPVKYSGNTTNLAAHLSKWHPTVKVELAEPAKNTAKQASLRDVGIRAVPRKKLLSLGALAQTITTAIADFIV